MTFKGDSSYAFAVRRSCTLYIIYYVGTIKRTTYLQHGEYFLRELVIKVGVLGVGHVVYEDETSSLRIHRL